MQVLWFVFAFGLVGCIPHERLRLWMNNMASLIAFRIVARSLSAVIIFHNQEYKPKNCGFCVANHTTPIDVSILASDNTYSLVRNMKKRARDNLHAFWRETLVVCVHEKREEWNENVSREKRKL
jgi:hypothetical protein